MSKVNPIKSVGRGTRFASRAAAGGSRPGLAARSAVSLPMRGVGLALALAFAGCAQVAAVRNPELPACAAALRQATTDILVGQGETEYAAGNAAQRLGDPVVLRANGPRPVFVRAPSGVDYGLFFDRRDTGCVLRLYMRRQGFTTYTNNITYIDSRRLEGCDCGR